MQSRIARVFRATLAATACLVVAPTIAQAAQLTVDDNGAQCPTAGFTSLNAAITAAASGDTISICPGTYTSTNAAATGANGFLIDKALTIKGAGADLVRIMPQAGNISDGTARDANGNVISVTAGPTSISGVTVDASNAGGSGTVDAGVVFLNAAGALGNSRVTLGQQVGISGTGIGAEFLSQATSGTFSSFMAGNQIDGYGKAGVLVDSADAGGTFSGSTAHVVIFQNTIHGGGPAGDVPQGQNGIQVSRGGEAVIASNQIELNRSCGAGGCNDARESDGVLIFNQPTVAKYNATVVHNNNIQGNGFGLLATNASFAAPPGVGASISATNNYWGSPSGPTPTDVTTTVPPSDNGDRVNLALQEVDSSGFANVPFVTRATPQPEPDAAPAVNITSPSDGATVQPGAATAINATATDDIGVRFVTFRKGNTVLSVSSGSTGSTSYSATYTPSAAEAGTSQVITATATDSRGQTSTSAISLKVSGPIAVVDKPPTVSLSTPKSARAKKVANLSATATDDTGVANVTFYAGNRQICVDTSAPYTCAWKPRKKDVGRVTLIAIVTDKSGQTAVSFKTIKVKKAKK